MLTRRTRRTIRSVPMLAMLAIGALVVPTSAASAGRVMPAASTERSAFSTTAICVEQFLTSTPLSHNTAVVSPTATTSKEFSTAQGDA